ncbi:hypothetical protein LI82_07665 [Methanococcoides methylutens]|uniref:Uncharacterized protein n=1 Tax=Methanococcoides methylutens TaxID=2226 RepID=A0A099T3E1_METMT|nr:hypothetical protein [Methanococcoides methylutens]KGK98713.1 hypothetical protein LI82_07665 [Methanococcoides methylutens]
MSTKKSIRKEEIIEFDNEVVDYVSEKGFVRKGKLIDYLYETHPKDSGYSKPNVEKKISKLIQRGILTTLKFEELEAYGIEETDRRSSYILPKDFSGIKNHIDFIFEGLETDNINMQKRVLDEINLYKTKYSLTPNQLDVLIQFLNSKDDELTVNILRVIYRHLINKNIKPKNEKEFLDKLRRLLKEYPHPVEKGSPIRSYIIWLLGFYNDEAVIDRLIEDAKDLDLLISVFDDYSYEFTAKLIEDHRTELFGLENELIAEGKLQNSGLIAEIRKKALTNLEKTKEDGSWSYRPE